MNKKLSAVAVASIVAAPAPSLAGGHDAVTLYGRINNAIDIRKNEVNSNNINLTGIASRLGVRYSKDLGNGLTTRAQYEFATSTDKRGNGIENTRIATVGLSAAFGKVDLGNQWSAYYNTVGTFISPTYSLGAYMYSEVGGGPLRASNTLKYSNSFGPLDLQIDLRLNEDNAEGPEVAEVLSGDGFGLGLSVALGDNYTLALAADTEDTLGQTTLLGLDPNIDPSVRVPDTVANRDRVTDAKRVGFAINGVLSPAVEFTLGVQSIQQEDYYLHQVLADNPNFVVRYDRDQLTYFAYFGGELNPKTRWLFGYATEDDENDGSQRLVAFRANRATQSTLGLYHNVGHGLRLYYEGTLHEDQSGAPDQTTGERPDVIRHLLGMRVDF